MDLDPTKEVTVTCECGMQYRLAGAHIGDAIQCNMCGRMLRTRAKNVQPAGHPAQTALSAHAENACEADKLHQAAQYARDHQYKEAERLYRSVLAANPAIRGAFYGLGYCHYREGDVHDAHTLLKLAHECGHPTALDLLRKVDALIDV